MPEMRLESKQVSFFVYDNERRMNNFRYAAGFHVGKLIVFICSVCYAFSKSDVGNKVYVG